jgi:uncharacterized membrane protein
MTELNPTFSLWRRIILPASIILNLFLMALIGGHLWQVRSGGAISGMPLVRALRNTEAILPRSDAAAFGGVMRRDLPQYIAAARRLRQARLELRRQITAEHFDQDQARKALAAWQTAWNQFMGDVSGPLVDALAQISPDGRRKLVAARQATERTLPSP